MSCPNARERATAYARSLPTCPHPNRRRVLIALAGRVDDRYIAAASINALAHECTMSPGAVRNTLTRLCRLGYLTPVQVNRELGQWTPNRYLLQGPWSQ